MDSSQIWTPQLQLLNRRKVDRVNEPELVVAPDGRVRQVVRAYGDFSFQADLTDFPFDEQELHFALGRQPADVIIVARHDDIGIADSLLFQLGAAHGRQSFHPVYVAPVDRTSGRLDIVQGQAPDRFLYLAAAGAVVFGGHDDLDGILAATGFVAPRVGLVTTSC